MTFITEEIIEKVAEELSMIIEEHGPDDILEEMESEQPYILAYAMADSQDILEQEEKDYLLWMCLVIWLSFRKGFSVSLPQVQPDSIEEAEEAAWEILANSDAKAFRVRIDPFYENCEQEDLLAFIEDALVPDDESPISSTGREPVFVGAKAVLDGFIAALKEMLKNAN